MIFAQANPRMIGWCSRFSKIAGLIVLAVGGVSLAGRLTDWEILQDIFPSIVVMNPNTALAFILSGISVLLLRTGHQLSLGKICGALAGAAGLLTMLEYLFGWDLWLDHIFESGSKPAGRMAIAAAYNFFAMGAGLLLLNTENRRWQWLAHFCVFLAGSVAALAVVGFIFGIDSLQHVTLRSTGFYGGLTFITLGGGILLARPDAGLMRILTSDHTSSTMAARLVAGTILLPVILGWLCLEGFRAGIYGAVIGMALLSILSIFFLTFLVWLNARAFHRTQHTESYLASIVESTDEAIISVDLDGVIATWNRGAERVYGYSAGEIIGQPLSLLIPPDRTGECAEFFCKLNRGERIEQFETTRLGQGNRLLHVAMTLSPIKDARHRIVGISGIIRDISQNKRAERTSAAFSKLGQLLSATTTEKEAVKIILETADKMFGWDAASFHLYFPEQDAIFSVLAMDIVDGKRAEVGPGIMSRSPTPLVRRVINEGPQLILRDGKTLKEINSIPFGDKGRPSAAMMFVAARHFGRITGILAIHSYTPNAYTAGDLDALQALADHCSGAMERIRAEQRYRSIFENAINGLFQSSPDGRFVTANLPLARKLGYNSPDELIAGVRHIGQELFVQPERYEIFQRLLEETGTARNFHAQLRRRDGSHLWISLNARAIKNGHGEIFHYEGTAEDITDRKRHEREILLLAEALRSINDCVCITDLDDKILFVNESFLRTYGFETDELLGQGIEIVRSPKNPAELIQKILPATLQGSWHGELLNRRKNGEEFPISLSSGLIRDDQGQPVALIGVSEDITERKRAETVLADERNLLRTLLDNLPVCVFIKDLQGRFLLNNQTHLQFLGVETPAEAEGKTVFDFFPPEMAEQMVSSDQEIISSGQPRTLDQALLDANGEQRFYATTKVPLRDGREKIIGLVCFSHDLSERLNLEEQLRQSQKMESIGQLAGGVAHDFNNILTIIQGHAAFLCSGELTRAETSDAAQQISLASERAANLTSQLLLFSRRQIMQTRNLDLNEVLGSIVRMLRRLLREDIALQVNYAAPLPLIRADRSMIEQVILNLCVNARDAMPHGGKLNVRTAVREIQAADVAQNSEARAGSFVCLEVNDTGSGIAPENLSRIFEPFFTTKAVGKGTGLGLATVYGIVKQHNGWIDFSTEVGKGTAFKIFLPARADLIPTPETKAPAAKVRGGTETIFVVEDEAMVRNLVRNILEHYGYSVVEAASGAAALGVWRDGGKKIDLLLSDIVMPEGVSGCELAAKLQAEQPDLKVVFTSGYNMEIVGQDFALREGLRFLQKPYEPWKLAQTVREALDNSATGHDKPTSDSSSANSKV